MIHVKGPASHGQVNARLLGARKRGRPVLVRYVHVRVRLGESPEPEKETHPKRFEERQT